MVLVQNQTHRPIKQNREPRKKSIHLQETNFFMFYFFGDKVSLCCPGWNAVVQSLLTATSTPWAQAVLPQPPE